jgi:Ca-activated chloride channel family protein
MNREKGKFASALLLLLVLTCALSAQESRQNSKSDQQPVHNLNVDVNLVLATATVTDRDGRYVTGLEKENFKIFEDKLPQEILQFSSEDIPVSVGIVFDVSGSMKDKLKTAVQAAITFLKSGNPDDEYFLVEFSDKPTGSDFTSDIAKLQSRFMFSKAKGRTALYDAVYMGLSKLEQGNNPKRALLLITDGEDNRSRYTFSNVKEFIKEKDIQMYSIGISNGPGDASAEQGRALLRDLSSISGGESFFPKSIYHLEDTCRSIAKELKYQYVIGYRSTNTEQDGKFRKIKIAAEFPDYKLTVRHKQGYYAPTPEGKSGGHN